MPRSLRELARQALTIAAGRLGMRSYRERSYSQDGEDRILANLFHGQADGFFVDVGAHHPRRFSNTYLFYERGWRGINIDPVPGTKKLFARSRPRDITLECGVGSEAGELTYYLYDEPAYNSFNAETKAYFARRGFPRFLETRKVAVYTLAQVLDEHLPRGLQIDFLTVDAEGWDLQVLQSNDWTRYRPRAVVAEDGTDIPSSLVSPLATLLSEQGYTLASRTNQSVIWVDRRPSTAAESVRVARLPRELRGDNRGP